MGALLSSYRLSLGRSIVERLLPLLLMLAVAGPCLADDDYEAALRLRESREILPLEELLSRGKLGPDARILEIGSEHEHGRLVYEIEYVDGRGRIHEIYIDAVTGDLIQGEAD